MAIRHRIVLIIIAIITVILTFRSLPVFPLPGDNQTGAAFSGFSGVLRLWICEENSAARDSLSAWLIHESTQFEKTHDGIYVQITPVSAETLGAFSYAAALPPDMAVFTPGILKNTEGLVKTNASHLLRKELQGYENGFCVPIAMNAACWVICGDTPETLSGKTLLIDEGCENAALYALTSDVRPPNQDDMNFGIDLGLDAPDHAFKTPVPIQTVPINPGNLSRISKNACAAFIKGDGDALFISGKTLSGLTEGSFLDFSIVHSGQFYIDALSLLSVTDTPDKEKRKACEEFLCHLLSEESQARLASFGAFSVLENASIYGAKKYYSDLEMFLARGSIQAGSAFAPPDKESVKKALNAVFSNELHISDILPLP